MPNLGLTKLSALSSSSRTIGECAVRISMKSTPGYKADPVKILEQLKTASLHSRNAIRLIDHTYNEMRHTLDRLHYLLYLCNTQKSIDSPPR